MSTDNKIPQKVLRIQKEYGCNTSEYVATTEKGDIYSLSKVDDSGMPVPIGLPLLVIMKDGESSVVSGVHGLELMGTLFGNE